MRTCRAARSRVWCAGCRSRWRGRRKGWRWSVRLEGVRCRGRGAGRMGRSRSCWLGRGWRAAASGLGRRLGRKAGFRRGRSRRASGRGVSAMKSQYRCVLDVVSGVRGRLTICSPKEPALIGSASIAPLVSALTTMATDFRFLFGSLLLIGA